MLAGDESVEVVSVGVQGPTGASASFNDTEGDPAAVGTTAAADGVSSNAARRDHKHAINTTELDARYSQDVHSHAPRVIVERPRAELIEFAPRRGGLGRRDRALPDDQAHARGTHSHQR